MHKLEEYELMSPHPRPAASRARILKRLSLSKVGLGMSSTHQCREGIRKLICALYLGERSPIKNIKPKMYRNSYNPYGAGISSQEINAKRTPNKWNLWASNKSKHKIDLKQAF